METRGLLAERGPICTSLPTDRQYPWPNGQAKRLELPAAWSSSPVVDMWIACGGSFTHSETHDLKELNFPELRDIRNDLTATLLDRARYETG